MVTGAGGFVGANLVRKLHADGVNVHAVVRLGGQRWRLQNLTGITLHAVDISDRTSVQELVAEVKPRTVFHLSHYGGNRGEDDDEQIRRVIIDGTANLYGACQQLVDAPMIVHTGSSSEYGVKTEPMTEDMVLQPNTTYGCAKAWATLFGQHLARERGMPLVTLRLFSVYGPYESVYRLVPAVTLACLRHSKPQLSSPAAQRDFVHVDDVIHALVSAAERANELKGEIINVGTGVQSTVQQAVELIVKNSGSDVTLEWGSAAGRSFDRPNPWVADITKAQARLDWKATRSLADGIKSTVQWFYENQALYPA